MKPVSIMKTRYDHWKQVPRTQNAWPWGFFSPRELACRGTGRLIIVPEFVANLDLLRERYGDSLHVLSGYRTPYHNARVGGAPLSRHLRADAGDISIVDRDRHRLKDLAKEIGFTGFGHYRTFLHMDLGRAREWGRWNA